MTEPVLALPSIDDVAAQLHERWMQSKRAVGIMSRISPELDEELMRPYAELSEPGKDLNRRTVQAVYVAIEIARSMRELPNRGTVAAYVHLNWVAEKREAGVTSREAAEDGSELMVPYNRLTAAGKRLNIQTVDAVYAAIEAAWETQFPPVELVASLVHQDWMLAKLQQLNMTRISGETGEDQMVDYRDLSEREKDYDRQMVRGVYAAIDAIRSGSS